MIVKHRWRRESETYWAQNDFVPGPGEPIFEDDTGRFKLGNGVSLYSELPYFTPGDGHITDSDGTSSAELAAHIQDPTPHPAYDEGPSFLLLYQNAKV